jgi:hypothetical protein
MAAPVTPPGFSVCSTVRTASMTGMPAKWYTKDNLTLEFNLGSDRKAYNTVYGKIKDAIIRCGITSIRHPTTAWDGFLEEVWTYPIFAPYCACYEGAHSLAEVSRLRNCVPWIVNNIYESRKKKKPEEANNQYTDLVQIRSKWKRDESPEEDNKSVLVKQVKLFSALGTANSTQVSVLFHYVDPDAIDRPVLNNTENNSVYEWPASMLKMVVLKDFTLATTVKVVIKAYKKPTPMRTVWSMYGNLENVIRANRALTDGRVLWDNDDAVEGLINAMRGQNTIDILVIFAHWGANAVNTPNTVGTDALLAILSVPGMENPVEEPEEIKIQGLKNGICYRCITVNASVI